MAQPESGHSGGALPDPAAIADALAGLGERLSARLTATGDGPVALIAIANGGIAIAEALRPHLPPALVTGTLDPSFHRDDFARRGLRTTQPSSLPLSLENHRVILVDDVVHTGRTVRAALEALFERGRPDRVWLATLIDRPGRELPVQPDEAAFYLTLPETARIEIEAGPPLGLRLEQA